ncbi:toll/interleukin-1 receptor domain-containing protein [Lutibacter aestuarii]|uniref:Toll/interleukin-1 receptor domain-containing protein n=1 Tax=Lutibacter aestuarii TaxID=861111 RepID=A0ABW2ZA73_9FLAO
MQNNIYITYNPDSENERNLANDLYNKGRQNGYFIYLPERNYHNRISPQTKSNIDSSNWFVIFSTSLLSETVTEEIDYAFKSKQDNQIIVIYSSHNGKNINFNGRKPIEMYIEDYDLNSIEKFKNDLFKRVSLKSLEKKEGLSALEVLLGIGAAILLIGALTSNKKD